MSTRPAFTPASRAKRASRLFVLWMALFIAGAQLIWLGDSVARAETSTGSETSDAEVESESGLLAYARPGGGGSFKSGSSSSGSRSGSSSSGGFRSTSSSSSGFSTSSSGSYSGGGGGGGIAGIFFIPIIIIIVVIWVIASRSRAASSWSTGAPAVHWHPPPYEPPQGPINAISPRRQLLGLSQYDPNFSLVLFDDFLVALYTEIKQAQGRNLLARYQPYLGPMAMQSLGHPGGEITSVIVGSASIEEVHGVDASSAQVRVKVGFETNYGVRHAQGESAVYVHEEWTLTRRRDAKSRTPDKARVIGCPNCGAPLDVVAAGVCTHCRSNVTGGNFDWQVVNIDVLDTQARGPMLTSNVEEEGDDFPTIIDPGAQPRFRALEATDPGTTWPNLSNRIGLVFTEFQTAWAARDLVKMRPYMSDALFSTQTFWVEEYKRQGLRNITENPQIASLELANVTQDAFFDAVTVRVYASSLDFTVNAQTNQIVSGNRTHPRRYTEYWTMIRGRGAKGPPKTDKSCPNCGAPLDVSMTGVCNYCKVKVTTGQFDWVLSRIEQDEVYRG
jgi:hypothetical protein